MKGDKMGSTTPPDSHEESAKRPAAASTQTSTAGTSGPNQYEDPPETSNQYEDPPAEADSAGTDKPDQYED
jgi:hypothetical protein